MVLTRSQLEGLSKSELLDYADNLGEITRQFKVLESANLAFEQRIKLLEENYEINNSVIAVIKNSNTLLSEEVKRLQRTVTKNSQYARNRQLEIHNVPKMNNMDLPKKICSFLSLTGIVRQLRHEKCSDLHFLLDIFHDII